MLCDNVHYVLNYFSLVYVPFLPILMELWIIKGSFLKYVVDIAKFINHVNFIGLAYVVPEIQSGLLSELNFPHNIKVPSHVNSAP